MEQGRSGIRLVGRSEFQRRGGAMNVTFFKRYRMEVSLIGRDFTWPKLPEGYYLQAWDPSLLEAHSMVKFESFRDEIDARVFPCFTSLKGCRLVMERIVARQGFLPETTWLATYQPMVGPAEHCGTIQGIRHPTGIGGIQNVGVTPAHRGKGVATALLCRSLEGFRAAGLDQVYLEVTADNDPAVRLYRDLGFEIVRTTYKEVPTPPM